MGSKQGVAIIGALESLAVAALLTLVEVVGLCLVIYAGLGAEPVLRLSAEPDQGETASEADSPGLFRHGLRVQFEGGFEIVAFQRLRQAP